MKHLAEPLLRPFRQSKLLKLLAKVGLTFAALGFVLRGVDFHQMHTIWMAQNHHMFLMAMGLLLTQLLLGAMRWQLILEALSGTKVLKKPEGIKIYYISMFFSLCLPGTVGGDVIRVWLAKSDRVSLQLSIHSVIIDRMIALVALILLIMLMLPHLGLLIGFNPMPLLAALIAGGLFGLWLLYRMERLLARWEGFRLVRWILYFGGSLRLLFKHTAVSIASLIYAIVAHAIYCFAAYILAHSMHIDIPLAQCIALIPPITLLTTLPISIGGWGVRETGIVGMLGLVGVAPSAALMLSLQLGFCSMMISLPGGLLWLAQRRHMNVPATGGIKMSQMV